MPSSHASTTPLLPARLRHALLQRVAQAVNHVIQQNPQAQRRLLAHAGKCVSVRVAGAELVLEVTPQGGFDPVVHAAQASAVALTLEVDAAAALAAQWQGQRLGLSGVRIAGDADFAPAMSWLLGHVRWDAEDDLARWFGEVAAYRMAQAARRIRNQGSDWRERIESDLRDWLTEAPRGLVGRSEFADCSAAAAALRDATARLDKRIQILARRRRAVRS